MTAAEFDILRLVLLLLLGYLALWGIVAAAFMWRDRDGHPKDEHPVGSSSDDATARLIAKREANR